MPVLYWHRYPFAMGYTQFIHKCISIVTVRLNHWEIQILEYIRRLSVFTIIKKQRVCLLCSYLCSGHEFQWLFRRLLHSVSYKLCIKIQWYKYNIYIVIPHSCIKYSCPCWFNLCLFLCVCVCVCVCVRVSSITVPGSALSPVWLPGQPSQAGRGTGSAGSAG